MRAGGERRKGQQTVQVECVELTDTRGPTDDQRSGRSRKERGDGHGLRVVIRRVRYESCSIRLMADGGWLSGCSSGLVFSDSNNPDVDVISLYR